MTLPRTTCAAAALGLIVLSAAGVSSFSIKPIVLRGPSLLKAVTSSSSNFQIGEHVGRGSYGTVHLSDNDDDLVCKRAWTAQELLEQNSTRKADRCSYYFNVEQHCFEKMERNSPYISNYVNTVADDSGNKWMTFQLIADKEGKPAPTLQNVLELDWEDQHKRDEQHHHLHMVQNALGLPDDATFADTLNVVLKSLLQATSFIHSQGIVHRDLKPGNLLCDSTTRSLVLIDFGSAADMDPISTNIPFQKKRVGLEDDGVAISPIYAAPEFFIKPDKSPFNFDVFSSALIFSQLLFNYLDARTDAAFHQQIKDASYDLDAWLSRELSSKVRPAGLDEAVEYLQERPGLWGLLSRMFRKDPEERISSDKAFAKFNKIMEGKVDVQEDGPFFESVLRAMDNCDLPEVDFVAPRPLHFVASFRRGLSLGLVLTEPGEDVELEGDNLSKWNEATGNANPGDVFVMDIVPGGQAEELGVFEIGDQLHAVGNLPVANGGFEKVVDMLQERPKSTKYVKLQFDRASVRQLSDAQVDTTTSAPVRIVDEGAWSSLGRRKANEDFFVLHDINIDKDVLLAGVFDGHGGKAAAQTASQLMPSLFTEELTKGALTSRQAIELAWQTTCDTYRNGCDEMGQCVADYDTIDGILLASTGSDDLVAGTTASVVALNENELTVLNCGDSRTLLVNTEGRIVFQTSDHSPETEVGRLQRGIEQGLDYALPQCSLSKWWLQCGDMQYAVARSLEGPFATSKGIVSTPDVTSLRPSPGILLLASDGLWEVCGNEEIAKEVTRLRQQGLEANAAAKQLASRAVEKGSTDNVSVVVVYLE
jgi:serine/threonine protein phosphatase PrpC/serine/threonine protein kinase